MGTVGGPRIGPPQPGNQWPAAHRRRLARDSSFERSPNPNLSGSNTAIRGNWRQSAPWGKFFHSGYRRPDWATITLNNSAARFVGKYKTKPTVCFILRINTDDVRS